MSSRVRWLQYYYYSTQPRPSGEFYNSSASQDNTRTLFNQSIHYHIHHSLAFVPIVSQINPIYTLPHYFLEICFNIALPSTSSFSKPSLSFRFLHQTAVWIFLVSDRCHIPHFSLILSAEKYLVTIIFINFLIM